MTVLDHMHKSAEEAPDTTATGGAEAVSAGTVASTTVAEPSAAAASLEAMLAELRSTLGAELVAVTPDSAGLSHGNAIWSAPPEFKGAPVIKPPAGEAVVARGADRFPWIRRGTGKPVTVLSYPLDLGPERLSLVAIFHRSRVSAARRSLLKGMIGIVSLAVASAKYEERQKLLRHLLNDSSEGFAIFEGRGPDFPLMFATSRFLELVGSPNRRMIGCSARAVLGGHAALAACHRVANGGSDVSFVLPSKWKDASVDPQVRATVSRSAQRDLGRPLLIVRLMDVSRIMALEADRHAMRFRLAAALDSSGSGYLLADTSGEILDCNRAWARFFGGDTSCWDRGKRVQDANAFGSTQIEPVHGGPKPTIADLLNSSMPCKIHFSNGRVGLITSEEAIAGGRVLSLQDVTELVQAKAELAQKLEALESSADGLAITDPEGRYVFMNRSHATMFGYPDPAQLLGQHWSLLYTEQEATRLMEEVVPVVMSTGYWTGEAIGIRPDGTATEQEIYLTRCSDGKLVCSTRSIAERREHERERERLYRELARYERQEVIGQMAAGFAHDFNNLMSIVKNAASTLLDVEGADVGAVANRILEAATMSDLMLECVLDAGRQKSKGAVVDVVELCRRVARTLEVGLTSDQRIIVATPSEPVWIWANATQLMQTILNLGINARDVMPAQNGTVTIELIEVPEGADLPDRKPVVGTPPSGASVCIRVRDNGPGVPASIRDQIFSPFYSTKGSRGTGLGLSVVAGVTRAIGGCVYLYDALGGGSVFEVWWPVSRTDRPEDGPAIEPEVLKGARLLLVDDDPAAVQSMEDIFTTLGCEAVGVTDPREALESVRENPDFWDCIVTDYEMPHLTGADLLQSVSKLPAAPPIVLRTGRLDKIAELENAPNGFAQVLRKTGNLNALLLAVAGTIRATQ